MLVGLLRAGVHAELELPKERGAHCGADTVTFLAKGVHGFISLRCTGHGLVFLLLGAHIGAANG